MKYHNKIIFVVKKFNFITKIKEERMLNLNIKHRSLN
jgi:hypothetical protein